MAKNQVSYWKRREQQNMKLRKQSEEELLKEVEGLYLEVVTSVQKEIDAFFGKYASSEGISMQETKKRASDMNVQEFESKAKKYVKEKNFSASAHYELRLYNLKMKVSRLELLRSNILLELTASSDALQKLLYKYLSKEARDEFERQAGILGNLPSNNRLNIESIVNGSYKKASFSDRIWGILQIELRATLEKLLLRGIVQGANPKKLAIDLRQLFNVTKHQAERLARTELARVQSEVQKKSYQKNGVTQFIFIREPTACDFCKSVTTEPIKLEDFEVGVNVAPIHPNCRCSTAPYFDRDTFEKYLNNKQL